MKKLLMVSLAMIICSIAYMQDDELPEQINDAFKAKYPKAKSVYWYIEDNNYKIEFYVYPETFTTIYTETGEWIETAKIISDGEVPKIVLDAILEKYPGSEVSFAEFVENGADESFYRLNTYNDEADFIINVSISGNILHSEMKPYLIDIDEG